MKKIFIFSFMIVLALISACGGSPLPATLDPSSTVKGVRLGSTGLGTPNAVPSEVVAGTVTLTYVQAIDTSNETPYVTLFVPEYTASSKVVKYAHGDSADNFETDTAYDNEAITDKDFFIIKMTAQDPAVSALYYKVVVTIYLP